MSYSVNGASTRNTDPSEVVPDWLLEIADDIDVYVAQRDFEEAVSLAEKNRAFWESTTPGLINLHRDLKYTRLCNFFNYYCID